MSRAEIICLVALAACAPDVENGESLGDSEAVADDGVFSFVVLPDTQYLSQSFPEHLDAIAEWIATEEVSRDIRFVLHVGDMVQDGTEEEWTRFRGFFDRLRARMPVPFAVGNHDLDADGGTEGVNAAFPLAELQEDPSFGGAYADGRVDDVWYDLEVGGLSIAVVSVSWSADDAVRAWAGRVLADHPDHLGIFVTHDHLTREGARSERGELLWTQAIAAQPNAALVFSGHDTPAGASRLASVGDEGNTVHQLFANYQSLPFGGAGSLRIVTVDLNAGTLRVDTHRPALDWWGTSDEDAFTLTGLDFGR